MSRVYIVMAEAGESEFPSLKKAKLAAEELNAGRIEAVEREKGGDYLMHVYSRKCSWSRSDV